MDASGSTDAARRIFAAIRAIPVGEVAGYGEVARRALAFNWESQVGHLAIGELDGVPHLQLCENRPLDGLDLAEVHRLVLEIGGLGDRMERTLSAGGDLF